MPVPSPRYEVYNKDPTMILDKKVWQVWSVCQAPPPLVPPDENHAATAFVELLVKRLNEGEAKDYVASIP